MKTKTGVQSTKKLVLIPVLQAGDNTKKDGADSVAHEQREKRTCILSEYFAAVDGVDYPGLIACLESSIQDSCYTVGLMYASARALEAFGHKADCPATQCGLNMSSEENGEYDADSESGICGAGQLIPMIREAAETGRQDHSVALHYILLEKLAKLRPEAQKVLDAVNSRIAEQLADPGIRAMAIMTYLQTAKECGRSDEEEIAWTMPHDLKEDGQS